MEQKIIFIICVCITTIIKQNNYSLKQEKSYIDYNRRKEILKQYKKTKSKKIDKFNDEFIQYEISKNKILDNINGYKLDNNQKEAVISDELNTLVIAGAGSGKSLTIIGKVIYLINSKKVKGRRLLY